MTYPIVVPSKDRNNAGAIIGFSVVLILLNFISHLWFLSEVSIANMFLYGVAMALFLLGWLKQSEPKDLFKIEQDGFTFYHRFGRFTCYWRDISRMDLPTINKFEGREELNFIGIKFHQMETFYENFPLRLAGRFLTEQRNLLLSVASNGCKTGQCVPEDFVDSVEYKHDNGRVYKGLIGMFMYRSELLREHLGFQLYLPLSGTDQSPHKILNLLKEAKNQSLTGDFMSQS